MRLLISLVTMLVFVAASTCNASANEYGGWRYDSASIGTVSLLGMRSSITEGTSPLMPRGSNLMLVRNVLEFRGSNNSAGLIQTGFGKSADADVVFDSDYCGVKVVVHDFMEWKPVTTSGSDYRCAWMGSHDVSVRRTFTVGKDELQNVCTGCYDARIDGSVVGPGQVSLASNYSAASSATFGEPSGEVTGDDSAQYMSASFGDPGNTGGIDLQWTGLILHNQDWHTISASDESFCRNSDMHFNFSDPFLHGDYVYRRVSSGVSC